MSEGIQYVKEGYPESFAYKITGITGTGLKLPLSFERPMKTFSVQVYGIGAPATSWTVNLLGGYDSAALGILLAHTNTDGDKKVKSVADTPVKSIDLDVNALSLGSATGIVVVVTGSAY